jgi:hypothetical protein
LSQICFRHHQKLSLNYQTRPDPKFLAVVNVTKLLCLDLSSSSLQKSHWRTAVLEYTTGPVLAGKKQYIFLRNGYRYNSMDIVVGSDSTFKAGLRCHLEGKILRYLLKMDCKFYHCLCCLFSPLNLWLINRVIMKRQTRSTPDTDIEYDLYLQLNDVDP